MRALRRFGRFWYEFLIGDDWLAAAGVALALVGTGLLADGHDPWWLLPVAVAAVLVFSVRRAAAAAPPHRWSDDAEPRVDL
jgi:hypothetical protein